MPIIAKKWRKVLFSYEHNWMVTDPWFLIEQSVNMYFENFLTVFFSPSYRMLTQEMAGKNKVNSL